MKKIKVNEIEETCGGCPTIFEFKDEKNNEYYFRLRYGGARIVNETKNKTLVSGSMSGFDGVCNWDDVKIWAKENGLKIKDV